MVTVTVADLTEWRETGRRLLARATPPDGVMWTGSSDQPSLPLAALEPQAPAVLPHPSPQLVPGRFVGLAEVVACHRSTGKWNALYRLLWRVASEGANVLACESDEDVHLVSNMAAQVRRDEHKMRAFVRFAPVSGPSGTRYVAWYEPDHLIVRRAAPFFADRFASMDWSILTPDLSVHWDRGALSFLDGVPAPMVDAASEIEELWRVYYEAIFNPARVNPGTMAREMPARRWRKLPEGALIPQLLKTAHDRTNRINASHTELTARLFVPTAGDLDDLRRASSSCRGCPLHAPATQVVFGEGPKDAAIVLVGEQPGDAEDLSGRPFVGPTGQVLDSALANSGLDRQRVYLTNAVKHFSFEPRGKRRIHQTPRLSEIHACRPGSRPNCNAFDHQPSSPWVRLPHARCSGRRRE